MMVITFTTTSTITIIITILLIFIGVEYQLRHRPVFSSSLLMLFSFLSFFSIVQAKVKVLSLKIYQT